MLSSLLLLLLASAPEPSSAGWILGDEAQSCDTACAMHGGCDSGAWPQAESDFDDMLVELNYTCAAIQEGKAGYDPSVELDSLDCGWRGAEEGCGWSGKVYYPCDDDVDMLMRCGVEPPERTRRFCPCQHVTTKPLTAPPTAAPPMPTPPALESVSPTMAPPGASLANELVTPAPPRLETFSPTSAPPEALSTLNGTKTVQGIMGLQVNDPGVVTGETATDDAVDRFQAACRRTLADMTGLPEGMVKIIWVEVQENQGSSLVNLEVEYKIQAETSGLDAVMSVIQAIEDADLNTFTATLNERLTASGLATMNAEVLARTAEASREAFSRPTANPTPQPTPQPTPEWSASPLTPSEWTEWSAPPPPPAISATPERSASPLTPSEWTEWSAPPPPPVISTASRVAVNMRVHNVNFNELTANAAMMKSFEASIKQALVNSVGGSETMGITEGAINVQLSEGSVQVEASIDCEQDSIAGAVQDLLTPDSVGSNVVSEVSAISGIDSVTTGSVEVAGVTTATVAAVDTPIAEPQTPAPAPLASCGWDAKVCKDGTAISRNPSAGCEFPACPTTWTPGIDGDCPEAEFHYDFDGEVDGHKVYQDIYIKAGDSRCIGGVWARKPVPAGSVALNATILISEVGCAEAQAADGVGCPMLEVALYPTEELAVNYEGGTIPTVYRWCFGDAPAGGTSNHCDATVVVEVGAWYGYVFNFQGFWQKYTNYAGHDLTLEIAYKGGNVDNSTSSKALFRNDVMEWHSSAWRFGVDGKLLRSSGDKDLCVVPEGPTTMAENRQLVLAPCIVGHKMFEWLVADGPEDSKIIAFADDPLYCIGLEDGIAFHGAQLMLKKCNEAAAEIGEGDRWLIYADQVRSYDNPDFFMAAADDDLERGVTLQVWGARKAPFHFLNEQMIGLVAPETSYDLREQSCDDFVTYRVFGTADWSVYPCGPWGAPCIPAKARCNGVQNCMNGFDEAGCAHGGALGDRGQKIFGGPQPMIVKDEVSTRCGWEAQVCPDGTAVSRNAAEGCAFPLCPAAWESNGQEVVVASEFDQLAQCGSLFSSDFVGSIASPEGMVEGDHDLLLKRIVCSTKESDDTAPIASNVVGNDANNSSNLANSSDSEDTWARKEVPIGSYALNASFVIAEQCKDGCQGPMVTLLVASEGNDGKPPIHYYRWCFNAHYNFSQCDKQVDLEVGQWYSYLFNFNAFHEKFSGEFLKHKLLLELSYSAENQGTVSTIWRTNRKRGSLDQKQVWNAHDKPYIKSAVDEFKCVQVLNGDGMIKDMAPVGLWPCSDAEDTFRWTIDPELTVPQKIALKSNPSLCLGHRDERILGKVDGVSQVLLTNCDNSPSWVYDHGQLRLADDLTYYLSITDDAVSDGSWLEVRPVEVSAFRFLNLQVRDIYAPDKSYQQQPVSCEGYLKQLSVDWAVFRCNAADDCVPSKAHCNGIRNCVDGIDEVGCVADHTGGDKGMKLFDGGLPPNGGGNESIAVASLAPNATKVTPAPKEKCGLDVKVCPDGTGISRDQEAGCEFRSCPAPWESNANDNGASLGCVGSTFRIHYTGPINSTTRGLIEASNDALLTQGQCPMNTPGSSWMSKQVPLNSAGINMSFVAIHDEACVGPTFSLYLTDETDQTFTWCFNNPTGKRCDKYFTVEQGLWYTYLLSFEGFSLKFPHHAGRNLTFAASFSPCPSTEASSLILRTSSSDGHSDQNRLWTFDNEIIKLNHSEQCLAVAGSVQPSFVEGRETVLWICNRNADEFRWESVAAPETGSFVIRSRAEPAFCLATRDELGNGSPLIVTACNNFTKPNTLWYWDGSRIRLSKSPAYDITIEGSEAVDRATVIVSSADTAPFRFLNEQALAAVKPDAWFADGPRECDEVERSWSAEEQYRSWAVFHCSPEECISKRARCNGVENCEGGTDEVGCQQLGGGDRGELSLQPPSAPVGAANIATSRRLVGEKVAPTRNVLII